MCSGGVSDQGLNWRWSGNCKDGPTYSKHEIVMLSSMESRKGIEARGHQRDLSDDDGPCKYVVERVSKAAGSVPTAQRRTNPHRRNAESGRRPHPRHRRSDSQGGAGEESPASVSFRLRLAGCKRRATAIPLGHGAKGLV